VFRVKNDRPFLVVTVLALALAALAGLGFSAVRHGLGSRATAETSTTGEAGSTPTTSAAAPSSAAASPTGAITLQADRSTAASGDKINLTGQVSDASGSSVDLVVQERRDGQWSDFPATGKTRSDGTFSTYVIFGRTGAHEMRVSAPATGEASNPVTITVS
jgi:hypothetical protein